MAGAQNSAKNSAKRGKGNPDKIVPYRFQPGQSGNPGGRPKSKRLTAGLMRVLEREDEGTGETGADEIAEAMYKAAKAGDIKAAALIADRTEGKPPQALIIDANARTTASERIEEVIRRAARGVVKRTPQAE